MKATPSDATPPPAPEPAAPPPETVAAVPTPTPEAPAAKPAVWPEWFGAVDIALGIMVLIVAFLAASYTAHNSDLLLHLATGRLIAEGNYSPATDPFTFAGEGRAWVDSSWLYALGLYALYTVDPTCAAHVAIKAVLFTLAFGLLAFLRRPGQALWPWAIVGALGIVASAFYMPLRPIALSTLFLSVTLVILFRLPWRPGSWREPGLLAGLFALWANIDSWFLLGPLTVALVLIGEKLNVFMARGEDPIAADDPFPPAPPTKGLVRALAIGAAACLLNPMVLGAVVKDPGEALTQLVPWELGFHTPAGAPDDRELVLLTNKPLKLFDPQPNEFLWFQPDTADEEIKINAVAYFILAIVVLVSMVVGIGRLRATHLLLVIVFAVLSLTHTRLIPFFAIVAVPIAAMYLNLLSKRAQLTTWADTSTQMLLGSSALGRVMCIIGVLMLIGASYPGWLHPPQLEKSLVNRLDWGMGVDPGLERAAKELVRLRAEAGLPAEVRGLSTSVFFGDYCAWYAPGEKTFTTTRFAFHRNDLPDLLTVRASMIGRRSQGTTPLDRTDVARICEARGAGFLTIVASYRMIDDVGVFQLLRMDPRWKLWHLDGRSAIVGRPMASERAAFAKYQYDPVRVALATADGSIAPDPVLMPLLPKEDGWDSFLASYLDRPKTPTPDMDDAVMMTTYLAYLVELARGQEQRRIATAQDGAMVASPVAAVVWNSMFARRPVDNDRLVIPVLTLRSARKAVAANPDRAEAYLVLATAYRQPFVPVLDTDIPFFGMPEQQLQMMTAMARYLARIATPEKSSVPQAQQALQECLQLAEMYIQTGQMDFALPMYKKAVTYARVLPPNKLWEINPPTARQPLPEAAQLTEFKTGFLKQMEGRADQLERQVDVQSTRVLQQGRTPFARFTEAAQKQLPALALKQFRDTPIDDFGAARDAVIVQAIILEFKAGHLERAVGDLNDLESYIKQLTAREPNGEMTMLFRALSQIRARLEGNTQAVIESLNQITLPTIDPAYLRVASDPSFMPIAARAAAAKPIVIQTLEGMTGATLAVVRVWLGTRGPLIDEMMYHYDRAMLDLLDGNPNGARRRFEMAAKPQGVDLSKLGDPHLPLILRYLELLRQPEPTRR